jgi:hypothetical protein
MLCVWCSCSGGTIPVLAPKGDACGLIHEWCRTHLFSYGLAVNPSTRWSHIRG